MNFRALVRQLGVGPFLLRLQALHQTGARAVINRSLVRSRVLPRILKAPPIPAGEGLLELHMLLQKTRVLEGAWCLYSLLYYAGRPLRVVVHNDGTLDARCGEILGGLFPGIHIIPREEADSVVTAALEKQGFRNCLELRRRHIFGLKLFDPFIFSHTPSYVTLDSDILTFSVPHEILDTGFGAVNGTTPHLYSPDCWDYSMALSPEKLHATGLKLAYRLNAGLLKIQRAGFSLERVEAAISRLDLLGRDSVLFYSEQTVYACELPFHGAVRLDPERYTICGDPDDDKIVTGHYCGDYYPKTRFYREGIPRLAREWGLQ
jgi:hypothetical protein